MRQVYMLGLGFALSLTVACAPTGFEARQSGFQKAGNVDIDGPVVDPVPKVCTIDPVDYELDMQVINFEMTSRTNISFGFNLLTGFLKAFGLKADIKSGQLDMEMALYNTMNPDEALVDVVDKAKLSDSSFGFSFDLGQLGADLNYYHRTPLAKLSNTAISNTFAHLLKDVKNDKILSTWNTRVTGTYSVDGEAYVTVAAGSVAGLLKGDTLTVYNVREHWEDPKKPCESRWNGTERLLDEPVQGTIVAVVANRATVKLGGASLDQIKLGAIAELTSKDAKKRTLRRSLRIGQLPPALIKIEGLGSIDIMKFILPQIDPVLRTNGYYIVDQPLNSLAQQ